jgi:predicted ATPase/class 3 adenylate cyclase
LQPEPLADTAGVPERAALLVVDVVDSTALTAHLGHDAAAALWTAHDRSARDLLREWRGREIDKTDGFLLLFGDPADALGYALAYRRAIARLDPPLKARAGLHVGEIELRETPSADIALGAKPLEVDGLAKSIAARVMAAALGGQTLLTADARAALGSTPAALRSHGHWSMKGLEDPIELFEAGDDDAAFAPPPDGDKAWRVVRQGDIWRPLREVRHTLPAERDAFVGRRSALRELAQRFEGGARLVSLTGIGGTGKTRLATRFGWRSLGAFAGGVWFCDLAPARTLEGLLSAVAQGLEVTLAREDPLIQLGHALAGRGRCLVVLDNFEQVVPHAEETLGKWLERAPDACFLVTTRTVLGIAGEETVDLQPLDLEDAKALFVSRAQSVARDAASGADDRAAIEPLVRLLDGLPLAIELAAARVRILSPRALLVRMGERFQLLSAPGARRDRQSTLRATFDWSWDLLSGPDRATLAQLSVFEGGFALAAAEAIVDLSAFDDAPWTMDAVQSLVDKSFVRALGAERFDLLMSVQAYASEHLRTPSRYPGSGPDAQAGAEARHGAWYAAMGPRRATDHRGADLDNLMVACHRAVARGDADVAIGALDGAWSVLRLRGPYAAALDAASSVLALPTLDDLRTARARVVLAQAQAAAGQPAQAEQGFALALAHAQRAGDAAATSRALRGLAALLAGRNEIERAQTTYLGALQHARAAKDPAAETDALNDLGNLASRQGWVSDATAHYGEALELARLSGYRVGEGSVRANLGLMHDDVGHTAVAREHFDAALVIARELGDRSREATLLCNMGLRLLLRDRAVEAQGALQSSVAIARELGYPLLESVGLCNVALVHEALGREEAAHQALDASLALARRIGDHRIEGQVLGYRGRALALRGRAEPARADLEAGLRLLREARDPLSAGILLCCRAEAQALAGQPEQARADLEEASALARECGAAPNSEFGWALARARRTLGLPA